MPTVKLYIAGPKSNRPNFNSFVFFRVVEFEPFNLLSLQAINPTSLNLDLGMVTSCCGCQAACWRPACCWLQWWSMSIGDSSQKQLGWFFFNINHRTTSHNAIGSFLFLKMGNSRPLFRLFLVFSNKHYKFFNNFMWKMSIQYTVLGFEPTTSSQ